MVERDSTYTLKGDVQVDDAYLSGELTGAATGRGSENKVPFVAAVSLNPDGHPLDTKMTQIPGFTRTAIAVRAARVLAPGCKVTMDGLACFAGVTDAGCLSLSGDHRRLPQTQRPARIPLGQHPLGQPQN